MIQQEDSGATTAKSTDDPVDRAGSARSGITREALSLDASDLDAIFDQARRERPNECCGVLLGRGRHVERVRSTINSLASPVAFEVDPRELLAIVLEAEGESLEIVGYYHSHPGSSAYPSPTDVRYARGWPGAVHLIASLAEARPIARAFLISTDLDHALDDESSSGAAVRQSRRGRIEELLKNWR